MSDDNKEKPVFGGNTGLEKDAANVVSPEIAPSEINLSDPIEFLLRYSPEGPWVLTALKKSNGKQYPVTCGTYR